MAGWKGIWGVEGDKMVIFVTVGTERYDNLIKKIDELVGEGKINEKVIMKIGRGKYIPRHCEYFRFAESLDLYIREAELIIGHGGVATVLESIIAGKKFIGVANISPEYPDRHQEEILEKMSKEGYIIWCKDLDNLYDYYNGNYGFLFIKKDGTVIFSLQDMVFINEYYGFVGFIN